MIFFLLMHVLVPCDLGLGSSGNSRRTTHGISRAHYIDVPQLPMLCCDLLVSISSATIARVLAFMQALILSFHCNNCSIVIHWFSGYMWTGMWVCFEACFYRLWAKCYVILSNIFLEICHSYTAYFDPIFVVVGHNTLQRRGPLGLSPTSQPCYKNLVWSTNPPWLWTIYNPHKCNVLCILPDTRNEGNDESVNFFEKIKIHSKIQKQTSMTPHFRD